MKFLTIFIFFLFLFATNSFAQKSSFGKNKNTNAARTGKVEKSFKRKNKDKFEPVSRMKGSYRGKSSTDWTGEPRMKTTFKKLVPPNSYFGFGAGSSNYYGETTNWRMPVETILKMTRWNIQAHYGREVKNRIGFRFNVAVARISGDDNNFKDNAQFKSSYDRGLHFRNDLKEFSLQGIYQFKKPKKPSESKGFFTPFLFAGIGAVSHNPKARATYNITDNKLGAWTTLKSLDTEGQSGLGGKKYSTILITIPFGMGFNYRINEKFSATFEGGFRYNLGKSAGYLDDISKKYIANAEAGTTTTERFSFRVNETKTARTGEDRVGVTGGIVAGAPGSEFNRGIGRSDLYFLTCFKINYHLFAETKCYTP